MMVAPVTYLREEIIEELEPDAYVEASNLCNSITGYCIQHCHSPEDVLRSRIILVTEEYRRTESDRVRWWIGKFLIMMCDNIGEIPRA